MNPKACSSLIGDIKLGLDGKAIYKAVFSTFEKIFQKQAKGYLNKQVHIQKKLVHNLKNKYLLFFIN